MQDKPLNIGILGTRGIPNRYGGFETCAEQIGQRLVSMGHKVSVYCPGDHPLKDKQWNGIDRIIKKNPEALLGSFGQFIYDFFCNRDSRKRNFDIVLHLGYTSDSVWNRFWTSKSRHIVNMDGMEWKREKYHPLVRRFLKKAEGMAVKRASCLIADNEAIGAYLREKYKHKVHMIPYGAIVPPKADERLLSKGLEAGGYDLMVARMEPENNIETAIKAKLMLNDNLPLLIIGNLNKYKLKLQRQFATPKRIIFHEPVYDFKVLSSIRQLSRYYIHGHSAGGTNPSLLEAMASECNIIAHHNPYNQAVLKDRAFYFSSSEELAEQLSKHPSNNFVSWKKENMNMVMNKYNWDIVSKDYEEIFRNV